MTIRHFELERRKTKGRWVGQEKAIGAGADSFVVAFGFGVATLGSQCALP
jgi:hypothetical protein